ncbi:MAG TPA: NAD(+)/NADH kinase [Vicinamibacterales bacterium]|nr:NAD(+)/NADH kinase [Vicinamibacterales bacterium]
MTRVGLVARRRLEAAASVLAELAGWLEARDLQVVFETETAALAGLPPGRATSTADDLPGVCDLIVVLGGDGTLIRTASRIARAGVDIPILGVNFGSLGFLTEITLPELYGSLAATLAGTAVIERRMMLAARIVGHEDGPTDHLVLNDIVITKGAMSRIIEIAVEVDGQSVMRVHADGLIVASPTGSTAYNLSAGGPIVHPSFDAVILTAIAPHTLTNRPVVIPGAADVRVRPVMDDSEGEVFVTFDGQLAVRLSASDVVSIRRAGRSIGVVRSPSRSYFELLRDKLKWGGA